jgi:uncharacterized membrane protein
MPAERITIKRGKVSHPIYQEKRTFGQKAADNITKWAGSWIFILAFIIAILIWIALNTIWLIFGKAWDIYPFILLNLALSLLAAIQAPLILMSQNRQTEIDRNRSKYDYAINRTAEREIREIKKMIERLHKKKR